MFVGTATNVATVIVGAALGAVIGGRLPARVQETILGALGLLTLALGVRESLATDSMVIPLAAVLIGALLGEWLRIEQALERLGSWLQARVVGGRGVAVDVELPELSDVAAATDQGDGQPDDQRSFGRGFVVATLVFCVGPLTVLGSIADGLGEPELLLVKAGLDGFAALAFASVYGWGVIASALSVLVLQGGIALAAGQLDAVLTTPMIDALGATGGVLLLGVALRLLDLKHIRVANLLPALIVAPVLVAVTGGSS